MEAEGARRHGWLDAQHDSAARHGWETLGISDERNLTDQRNTRGRLREWKMVHAERQ